MPTVALRFSPLAEHVRTARLVAVAVARRAGFEETQLDEIRIAIGEACARAVLRTRGDALVTMDLTDDDDRLDVVVRDAAAVGGVPHADDEDPLALALMAGMAEDVSVDDSDSSAGAVRMSWSRQQPSASIGDSEPAGP
ncbi:histidine kinase-like protein [Kineococcus xinjiangensis]|uniref:Histidine kinase-like protein n=1 Tax=Kineococcus xinjiangensis TaxID=512762 RepID=A0A2S6IFE9_9ACTN|nr:ATP-binding protein [Kineococcus xinjiangensis]PPK92938.1 histidine kinase-like protein [Kineococcus xinjiangensis]